MSEKNDLPKGIKSEQEIYSFLQGLNEQDLLTIAKSYWEAIYVVGCYSHKDVVMLRKVELEIGNRGLEIYATCTIALRKRPMDNDNNEDAWEHPKV